ncbi:hypothetical protein IWX48DRAFT_316967 [Phyllosticta citricarpa]
MGILNRPVGACRLVLSWLRGHKYSFARIVRARSGRCMTLVWIHVSVRVHDIAILGQRCTLLCLLLLLLHQSALDTTKVFCGCLDNVAGLIAVFEGGKHLAHLSFRVDVWAGASIAEVRQATQIAVLRTCNLERTCSNDVRALTGQTITSVIFGN